MHSEIDKTKEKRKKEKQRKKKAMQKEKKEEILFLFSCADVFMVSVAASPGITDSTVAWEGPFPLRPIEASPTPGSTYTTCRPTLR